jgi:hypothetical protein
VALAALLTAAGHDDVTVVLGCRRDLHGAWVAHSWVRTRNCVVGDDDAVTHYTELARLEAASSWNLAET